MDWCGTALECGATRCAALLHTLGQYRTWRRRTAHRVAPYTVSVPLPLVTHPPSPRSVPDFVYQARRQLAQQARRQIV
eukprot:1381216-Rhodomonas_salina.2